MQKHIYKLRFEVDESEWRARAKRALFFDLIKKYQASDKLKLLDFGCGTGVFLNEFKEKYPQSQIYGLEAEREAVSYCRKRGLHDVFLNKSPKLPFKNNFFDLVTSADVLEHVRDDQTAIKELFRVLKPGGLGTFLVPTHKFLWSTRDTRLHHFRRYEQRELEKKCRDAGLKILRSKNLDLMIFCVLWTACLLAKKANGVPDIGTETPSVNKFTNELLYWYERVENKLWLPIGTSVVVVVQKNA